MCVILILHFCYLRQAQVSNALLSATDIVPTIAAITGARLPTQHIYDGMDISRKLTSTMEFGGHKVTISHN